MAAPRMTPGGVERDLPRDAQSIEAMKLLGAHGLPTNHAANMWVALGGGKNIKTDRTLAQIRLSRKPASRLRARMNERETGLSAPGR